MNCTRMCCEYKSLPIIFSDISEETIFEMNASEESISPKSKVTDPFFVLVFIPDIACLPPIPAVV